MDVPPLESFTLCPVVEAVLAFNDDIVQLAGAALENNPGVVHIILQRTHPDKICFYMFTRKHGLLDVYKSEIFY